jgi:hypothetical protein
MCNCNLAEMKKIDIGPFVAIAVCDIRLLVKDIE